MNLYKILVFQPVGESALCEELSKNFASTRVTHLEECLTQAVIEKYKAIVIDMLASPTVDFSLCETLRQAEALSSLPLILLTSWGELRHKLKAFEIGCDDYIESDVTPEEACARINKAIYNCIANEQLKSRLQLARETATTAMSDNSNLGASVQFLLEVNRCDNLDELGQLFLTVIERYQLSCSLQMRSLYGAKNMDASGLARDLEAQLLDQMKDAGRYIDFGRRTIINHGQASLLIRNMPLEDEKRYSSLKDSIFALIQGVDARIKSLDNKQTLEDEKKSLHHLSSSMQEAMNKIDSSYQTVMREIVTKVENMAELIQHRIPALALNEEQERFFEQVVENCVVDANQIFNEGLKVDECFQGLSAHMHKALNLAEHMERELTGRRPPTAPKGDSVELF